MSVPNRNSKLGVSAFFEDFAGVNVCVEGNEDLTVRPARPSLRAGSSPKAPEKRPTSRRPRRKPRRHQ
jgi:hypothetical protein